MHKLMGKNLIHGRITRYGFTRVHKHTHIHTGGGLVQAGPRAVRLDHTEDLSVFLKRGRACEKEQVRLSSIYIWSLISAGVTASDPIAQYKHIKIIRMPFTAPLQWSSNYTGGGSVYYSCEERPAGASGVDYWFAPIP